jgi:uncharacterized lipoprotein YddW (UPF0748 family)
MTSRSSLAGAMRAGFRRCAIGLCFLFVGISSRSQAQQFRAAWADVFHVGMQNSSQVDTMVSTLVAGHYNAVIVQVQAYMDNATASHGSYWNSSILPHAGYVTGSFDPLGYLCQRAHANGIEVHAWLGGSGGGMFRVSQAWPPSGNAVLAAHPEWMMVPRTNSETGVMAPVWGGTGTTVYYLLDMGSPDAQEYIVSIVKELVSNYPIDGINWDDEVDSVQYTPVGMGFPAYSAASYPKSGLARYRALTGFVGTPTATDTTYGNYRRRYKNELMARCQAEIQSIKTNPRQPLRHSSATMAYGGPPSSCATFNTEEAYLYYSDWPTMLQNGWVDAVIPMNYKANSNNAALFNSYCDRAYSCWRYNRHIFMGLGAYLSTKAGALAQLQYAFYGQAGGTGFNGAATYSYGVPYAPAYDTGDWWSYIVANLYTNVVAPPAMPWRSPATASEGIMWGRIRDALSGTNIDDATVTVIGGPTVKTDGNGYYVATLVPGVAAGTVRPVTASKSGFTSVSNITAKVFAGDVARYDLFFNVPSLAMTKTATNTTLISWRSPSPGWVLQQITNVVSTNWIAPAELISDNGTDRFITLNPPVGTRFFRLVSP